LSPSSIPGLLKIEQAGLDIELGDKSVLDPLLRRVLISTASTA
jgi:hypothetical protein